MIHQEVHPGARQALELVLAGKSREAEGLVDDALLDAPSQPDLVAAKGTLLCYAGQEVEAIDYLSRSTESELAAKLSAMLQAHFHARIKLAEKKGRKDAAAQKHLAQIEQILPTTTVLVGVSLTACLIVKNEEGNLRRCLDSLKGTADEIVVIDTGSTDATVQIAESFGAKIGHFAWTNDFAQARNESLKLATGDWILWIDADEELTADSKANLEKALVRPHFGGFAVEIVNYTADNNDASTYVHSPIRLFRRMPKTEFTGRIHEQVVPSIHRQGLPWAYLQGVRLLHHGYRPGEMESKGKVERTVSMLEREVLESPQDPFHWFNLANAYTSAGRWPEAEHAARRCAKLPADAGVCGPLNYQLLTNALLAQDKLDQAIEVCDQADAKGCGGILNEFERANVLMRKGDIYAALEAADRCIAAEWQADTPGDYGIYTYKRYIVRGQILALFQRYMEALEMFDRSLAVHPSYGPALYSKGATLEKLGDPKGALEAFLKGREDGSVWQICTKAAARVCMHMGLPRQAATFYQEAWQAEPADTDCWVGWAEAANAWGDVETIVNAYESFCSQNEPTVEILINWGRALQASGQLEKAMACYTEAIKRDGTNGNAYFNCGDLLYQMGQYQDAAHLYENGLRHAPMHAEGWFVLGNALAQMGLDEAAKIAYGQVLGINPRHSAARHNLEQLLPAA